MGAGRGVGGLVSVAPPRGGGGANTCPVFSNSQLGASPRPAPSLCGGLNLGRQGGTRGVRGGGMGGGTGGLRGGGGGLCADYL